MNQIQPRCQVDNDTLHLVALLNPHLRYVRRHVCGVDWDTALIGGDLDYEETLLRTSLQRSIWAIFDYVEGILPGCDQACLPKELVLQPFRGMLSLRLAQVWHASYPDTPVPEWLRIPLANELVKKISCALKSWNFEAKIDNTTQGLLTILWITLKALEDEQVELESTIKGVAGWRIYWAWKKYSKSDLACMKFGWESNICQVKRQLNCGLPSSKKELPTHMRIAISAVLDRAEYDEALQRDLAALKKPQKEQLALFWNTRWNQKARTHVPTWLGL
jgi:hypothetical protein